MASTHLPTSSSTPTWSGGRAPEGRAPEGRAPEGRAPDLRAIRLPEDIAGVEALDRTFTTTQSYDVVHLFDDGGDVCGFRLEPGDGRPVTKTYDLEPQDGALVAEMDGRIVGYAYVESVDWNRRAILHDLYVDGSVRGSGIGRALLESACDSARASGARCLWLETQNVNGPAVGFYRRMGFTLAGLDETLYDGGNETALYLAKELG